MATTTKKTGTIVQATVLVKGIRPLLINTMTPDEIMALNKTDDAFVQEAKQKVAVLKKLPLPEQIAKKYELWRDPKTGKIGIWSHMFYAALVEAGKLVKYDAKRNLTNASKSLVPGLMAITASHLPFNEQGADGKGTPYADDYRRGNANQTDMAVCVARPRIDEWSFYVDVEIDTTDSTAFNPTKARALFDVAGRHCRLGSFRSKADFGSFRVADWEENTATA